MYTHLIVFLMDSVPELPLVVCNLLRNHISWIKTKEDMQLVIVDFVMRYKCHLPCSAVFVKAFHCKINPAVSTSVVLSLLHFSNNLYNLIYNFSWSCSWPNFARMYPQIHPTIWKCGKWRMWSPLKLPLMLHLKSWQLPVSAKCS